MAPKSKVSIEPDSAHDAANADKVEKGERTRSILGDPFEFAFMIDPVREDGIVKPFRSYQSPRYSSRERHRYGDGPFCTFGATAMRHKSGVYLLCIGEEVMYVGIGNMLRPRFKSYGNIHAHNCFKRGRRPLYRGISPKFNWSLIACQYISLSYAEQSEASYARVRACVA